MNPIVIWRTQNGYIVTDDDGWMNNNDIQTCYVFNSLTEVAKHLSKDEKPKPEKKKKTEGRT
jgi:hypothetical protein